MGLEGAKEVRNALQSSAFDGADVVSVGLDSTTFSTEPCKSFDLVLFDFSVEQDRPGSLENIRASHPDTSLVVICEPGATGSAVEALQQGADDYVEWDLLHILLPRALRYALERNAARAEKADLMSRLTQALARTDIPDVAQDASPYASHLAAQYDPTSMEAEQATSEAKELEARVRKVADVAPSDYDRLATVVANVNIGLAMLDADAHIILVNDAFLHRAGMKRENVVGKRYADVSEPVTGFALIAPDLVESALATGERIKLHNYHLHTAAYPEGVYIDWVVQPVRDDRGTVTGAITISVDVTENVMAQREIEGARALFDTIIQTTPVGIVFMDVDMRVVRTNPAWSVMSGIPIENALGRKLQDLSPTSVQRMDLYDEVLAGNPRDYLNFPYDHPDGTRHYYDATYRPVRDPAGTVIGMLVSSIDVSEKIRAVREVEAQRSLLETLLDNTPFGIVYFDLDMRILNYNSRWADSAGFSMEEVRGKTLYELSPVALELHPIFDAVLMGESVRLDDMAYTPPGSTETRYYDVQMSPIRNAVGDISGLLSTNVDVTDRLNATQQIEAQARLLETIIEGTPVGLVFCDREMRIINCNAEWSRIVGVNREDALGNMLYSLVPGQEQYRPYHEQVLQGNSLDLSGVSTFFGESSEGVYLDVHMRPVSPSENNVGGLLIALTDVTERHRLDEQKDDFIALASHELRTPVTAIKGYAQAAVRVARNSGNDRLDRMLSVVNDQSDRLAHLIDDLLDVSRLERGDLGFTMERVDLTAMVSEIVGNMELTTPDFRFDLQINDASCYVKADRERIEQVLINLIQNAIKYSAANHQIEVSVRRDGAEAVVAVRDYGVGIPADQQSKVFNRFFRASNVPSRNYSGLGLGMYISKGIVTWHQGRMWLDSTEGSGSTFYFALPLCED